jgi:hypothetical protein
MPPSPEVLKDNKEPKLAELLTRINEKLASCEMLSPDNRIGHAWFMGTEADATAFKRALENKILPLLEEWFYGMQDAEADGSLEDIRSSLFKFNRGTGVYEALELDTILKNLKSKDDQEADKKAEETSPKK